MTAKAIAISLMLVGLTCAGTAAAFAADEFDTAPLVQIARRYGVPFAPKGARLVYARSITRPDVYSPAFLLEQQPNGMIVVLRGFRRETIVDEGRKKPQSYPVEGKPDDPERLGIKIDFHRISAFICAIQCAAAGDEGRAQFLWRQLSSGDNWLDFFSWDHSVMSHPDEPRDLLTACLMTRWRSELLERGADPREMYRQIAALAKEDERLWSEVRPYVFVGILAALYEPPPKAGSTEALLLQWARQPHPDSSSIYSDFDGCHTVPINNEPAREIIRRGYGSIPGLLALLRDLRMTAHVQSQDRENVDRVCDLADTLLEEISGDENYSHEPSVHVEWWEKVRKQNELETFARNAFRREQVDDGVPRDLFPMGRGRKRYPVGSITGVHEGPVRILAARDPSRLIPLFAEFVKHATPQAQPFALAHALVDSSLPRATTERLLVEYAQKGSLENRRTLLQILAKWNPEKCAEILLPILRSLPKDATGPYWTCPEANFSHVVMECEIDAVWRELLAAARRSVVGLRLQYMDPMDYSYIGDRNRSRRIAFLAAFLDDAEVRRLPPRKPHLPGDWDSQGKFSGPGAAFTFPEIEVRNYAGMQLACILDLCDSPEPNWTAAQWAALRAKVKVRLEQESLPNLEGAGRASRK